MINHLDLIILHATKHNAHTHTQSECERERLKFFYKPLTLSALFFLHICPKALEDIGPLCFQLKKQKQIGQVPTFRSIVCAAKNVVHFTVHIIVISTVFWYNGYFPSFIYKCTKKLFILAMSCNTGRLCTDLPLIYLTVNANSLGIFFFNANQSAFVLWQAKFSNAGFNMYILQGFDVFYCIVWPEKERHTGPFSTFLIGLCCVSFSKIWGDTCLQMHYNIQISTPFANSRVCCPA